MAKVVVALGSNLDDRLSYMRDAGTFLNELSKSSAEYSSIYESEPVGPSEFEFLNAVIAIETDLSASELLEAFKNFEHSHGRPTRYPKWTPRTIDLDIISYDQEIIDEENLTIPHPLYHERLFVLKPLQEILPEWSDPKSKKSISALILDAPPMNLKTTSLSWHHVE